MITAAAARVEFFYESQNLNQRVGGIKINFYDNC
jgi:hypothetical protein